MNSIEVVRRAVAALEEDAFGTRVRLRVTDNLDAASDDRWIRVEEGPFKWSADTDRYVRLTLEVEDFEEGRPDVEQRLKAELRQSLDVLRNYTPGRVERISPSTT